MAFYSTPEQRARRDQRRQQRQQQRQAQGIGNPRASRDRSSFWAGALMGAATATGGFFAIRVLERMFKKKNDPNANPVTGEAAQRLMVNATTGAGAIAVPALAPKPPVVKRTVIEEMVEDLED